MTGLNDALSNGRIVSTSKAALTCSLLLRPVRGWPTIWRACRPGLS